MPVGSQMDSVTSAKWPVVVNQRWHDAAISGACAACFAEIDVAGLVGKVGDDQDKIVASLSSCWDDTGFSGIGTIAA